MATNTPLATPEETPRTADSPGLTAPAPRLWPAWLISLGLGVALVLTVTPSIANKPRFFLMMGGPLVGGLLFSIWLLLLSRLKAGDRLRLAGLGLVLPFAAGAVSDSGPALRTAMWIYGVPLAVFTLSFGLTLARRQPRPWRLPALLLAAGWFSFATVRNEGFDGEYYPEFAWRWSAEHESTLPLLGSQPAAKAAAADSTENAPAETTAPPDDSIAAWPGYRGPAGDGAAADTAGELDWRTSPPQVLWKISVGPAWSSFAWHNGRLFTQEQRREEECITCYSAADGSLIWSQASASRFTEVVSGAGPRSTPLVHNGRVYALGGRGLLTCLSAADGSLIWQQDLAQTIGARVPMWGFSGSPLPVGDRIVVFADGDGRNGLIAVNASSGEIAWGFESRGMNYTTVRDLQLCDQRCLVFCDGRGVHGLDAESGTELFSYRPSKWNAGPMVDPQPLGPSALLVALGDGVGLCRLNFEHTGAAWKITEAWTTSRLRPSFNDSLVLGDSIFGFNQDLLCCLDASTGDLRWRGRRYGFGQAVLLKNSGRILIAAENGDAVLVRADGAAFEELGRVPVLDDKTWNHPIVVGDRAYLRNGRTAAALLLSGSNPAATATAAAAAPSL
jgi:outer membrane protein assembly factor BamB